MRRVAVGEHTIAYRERGPHDAAPIVLVHGFVISSRYMEPLAKELAPRWRVLSPDLPGFGRSSKPRDALDIDGLADALAGFLGEMRIPGAPLVGNSMGCQVAVALAQRHPAMAGPLVLIGPTAEPGARSTWAQTARLLRDATRERRSLPFLHVPDHVRAGPRRILQTARHVLADRIEDRAPQVRVPALVLRGTDDPLVSKAFARRLARAFPRGVHEEMPGSPHAAHYTRARRTAERVQAFLDRARSL